MTTELKFSAINKLAVAVQDYHISTGFIYGPHCGLIANTNANGQPVSQDIQALLDHGLIQPCRSNAGTCFHNYRVTFAGKLRAYRELISDREWLASRAALYARNRFNSFASRVGEETDCQRAEQEIAFYEMRLNELLSRPLWPARQA